MHRRMCGEVFFWVVRSVFLTFLFCLFNGYKNLWGVFFLGGAGYWPTYKFDMGGEIKEEQRPHCLSP